jgi:hypothetical protein
MHTREANDFHHGKTGELRVLFKSLHCSKPNHARFRHHWKGISLTSVLFSTICTLMRKQSSRDHAQAIRSTVRKSQTNVVRQVLCNSIAETAVQSCSSPTPGNPHLALSESPPIQSNTLKTTTNPTNPCPSPHLHLHHHHHHHLPYYHSQPSTPDTY